MLKTANRRSDDPMLLLGRLDGRLHHSTCADIFLARSRLHGATALASLASVPIAVRDLQDWIAGRSPPPRASEGLNDPISVAALFHIALTADEDASDPLGRATLNVLRTILDDRADAETYGRDDLAHFGPLWRKVKAAADAPFPSRDLEGIATRVFELVELTQQAANSDSDVVVIDGRSWDFPPRTRDRNWLIATAVPRMFHRAGFTTRILPSLVLLPKFLPPSTAALAQTFENELAKITPAALRELDAIERASAKLVDKASVTKRSKAPLLSRLQLAYPGLQVKAITRLLGITPQGARKLLTTLER
ncbi:hypothetical protein [Sphingomonas sp. YL-JM2C]